LGGGKADATDKRQRERAGAQELTFHAISFVRPNGALSRRHARCSESDGPRALVERDSLCSGGPSADITAGAGVWFHAARRRAIP
jgi:hypothetical protein